MDIDIYQQCPCHSGKKIKFCCGKDIVADLNQILGKSQSKQTQSAIDLIDRTIAKSGVRDCLLVLKTHILLTIGEIQQARETNEQFLNTNSKHPMGLQQRSLIDLAEGEIENSIHSLQDAMDSITGNEIPIAASNAFRMLGTALLQQGHVLSARAHLNFALMLKGTEDQRLQQMLYESYRLPGGPMLLKADYRFEEPDPEVEWAKKYSNVIKAMNRGQFRIGLKILKKIDKNWPDEPVVMRSIAIMTAILADIENMSATWHRLAEHTDSPDWQRIEAEALARLFSTEEDSKVVDIVKMVFQVDDHKAVFEIADASKRFVNIPPPEADPFEEGPAPRYAFVALDRDQLESPDDLKADCIPKVCGELFVYGKQTDSSARIVMIASESKNFDAELNHLAETFAKEINGTPEREVIATTTQAAEALTWKWHFPEGTSRKEHNDLVDSQRRQQILDEWCEVPFNILDGKTPKQAATDPELRIEIEALMLQLEQGTQSMMEAGRYVDDVRQALGLPEHEMIDGSVLDSEFVSPVRQKRLDFKSLTDPQLFALQADAISIGNLVVLRKALFEIIARDELRDRVPADVCYAMIARVTEDDDEAFEYMSEARRAAKESGSPIGTLLVQEFEMRLSRGLTEKLPVILKEIQLNHIDEPNVKQQLSDVLQRFGLIDYDTPGGPPAQQAPAPEPTSGGIWTPGQEEPAAATAHSSETEEPSKLWVPDSE